MSKDIEEIIIDDPIDTPSKADSTTDILAKKKPEAAKAESVKPADSKPTETKLENTKSESPKAADLKSTGTKLESAKPTGAKSESPKPESPKATADSKATADTKKVESPKPSAAKPSESQSKNSAASKSGFSKFADSVNSAASKVSDSGSSSSKSGSARTANPANYTKADEILTNVWDFIYRYRAIWLAISLFTMFVIIQLKYVYDVWFDPDELDIYTCAFEMFKGKVLYRDIPSQHMPFMYIISWIFYVFGARTATLQRLYFYMLFSGWWTAFIFIYKKHVNKWVFILQPFFYFAIIQNIDFATQILSENLCIIGAQIFFLEFMMFMDKREISTASCIRMSFATICTFGTMFMAIFPLFFVGLGVLMLEIKWAVDEQTPVKDWFIYMCKRYGKLVGIVAVPWVIYAIYCLFTRSFHDMGFCVYTINTLYYPKYMAGLGGSTIGAFAAPFKQLILEVAAFDPALIGIKYMYRWALIVASLYVPYKVWRKRGNIAGFTIFMYLYAYANRGLFNFHAKAFIGMLAMVTTYGIFQYGIFGRSPAEVLVGMKPGKNGSLPDGSKVDGDKKILHFDKITSVERAMIAFIFFVMWFTFSQGIETTFNFLGNSEYNHYETDTEILVKVTDEDERIWQTNVCNTVPWTSKRVTTGPTVSTPWMWEAVGSHKFGDEFTSNPPRVILFYLGYESWMCQMADYAPEAYYFIVNNYKYLPGSTMIWVHNSYYDEACRKLGLDPATEPNDNGWSVTPFGVDDSEMPGMTYEDRLKELAEREAAEAAAEAGEVMEEATEEITEEATEEVTEEVTTEATTEVTTEATTEDSSDDSTSNGPGSDDSSSDGPGSDDSSSNGPSSSSNGPGSSSSSDGPSTSRSPADENNGVIIDEDGPGSSGKTGTGTTSSTGPDGSTSNGPGETTVSPVDNAGLYYDDDGNVITEDTPGAVQAPDGSWILPDDSASPGSGSN